MNEEAWTLICWRLGEREREREREKTKAKRNRERHPSAQLIELREVLFFLFVFFLFFFVFFDSPSSNWLFPTMVKDDLFFFISGCCDVTRGTWTNEQYELLIRFYGVVVVVVVLFFFLKENIDDDDPCKWPDLHGCHPVGDSPNWTTGCQCPDHTITLRKHTHTHTHTPHEYSSVPSVSAAAAAARLPFTRLCRKTE